MLHEVTESQRGGIGAGYDLYSERGDDSKRYIEVKGTKGPEEFELKPPTLKRVFSEITREHFFIYVVTQALSNPKLNIIRAPDLSPDILLNVGGLRLKLRDVTISEVVGTEALFQ